VRFSLLPLVFCAACSGSSIPDAKIAARDFAAAIAKGDSQSLYAMLDARSKSEMTESQFRERLAASNNELRDRSNEIYSAADSIEVTARVRFANGSECSLVQQDSRFYLESSSVVPGGATTPTEALASLRDALQMRSYPALLMLLSPDVRAVVEAQLASIANALRDPSTIAVPMIAGDDLTIKLSNGHMIWLHREKNVWYVQKFQ
jgi:hypothetical protein